MRGRRTTAAAIALGAMLLVGCGGGTTTVIQNTPTEAQTATVTEQTTTVTEGSAPTEQAKAPVADAPEESGTPPDVVGLTLPAAQKLLKSTGFKADVSNTDTALGILVPENYTVCKESDPVGNLVPILAQKYGC